MADSSSIAKLQRAGNELGAKTTYQLFLEKEGVPAVRGFHIENINRVDLYPWPRIGARGVYLNLDGSEGVNDCYIVEIAPGKSLIPQKHMFEQLIYVVGGHGATTVWQDGGKKQTFEWGEGALFSPPLNAWYQHFNGAGDQPVRLLAMTNAPTVLNLYHNIDFVFKKTALDCHAHRQIGQIKISHGDARLVRTVQLTRYR